MRISGACAGRGEAAGEVPLGGGLEAPGVQAEPITRLSISQTPRRRTRRLTGADSGRRLSLTVRSLDPYRTPLCSTLDWRWDQGRSDIGPRARRPPSAGNRAEWREVRWRRSTVPFDRPPR